MGGCTQVPQPGLLVDANACFSHDIPTCWNVPFEYRYMFWAMTGCWVVFEIHMTGWLPTLQALVPTANAVMPSAWP